MGAAVAVSVARGPRWLTRDSGTLPLTLPPPVELVQARELVALDSCSTSLNCVRNTSLIQSLPCWVLNPISGERDVINHAQHLLKSQLARVVSHQTAGHLIPPGHVAIHKICHYGAHHRVLRYRAQHHKPGPILLL